MSIAMKTDIASKNANKRYIGFISGVVISPNIYAYVGKIINSK